MLTLREVFRSNLPKALVAAAICTFTVYPVTSYGTVSVSGLKSWCFAALGGEGFSESVDQLLSSDAADSLVAALARRFQAEQNANGTLTPQVAFKIYLEERLKLVPEETAVEVRDWLDQERIQIVERQKIGGHLDYVRDKVELVFPPEFARSFVKPYILAHEIEHLIQTRIIGIGSRTYFNPLHLPVHRFSLERGAIRAEGAFLLSLPKPIINENIEMIGEKIESVNLKNADILQRAFENALEARNTDEYIRRTWSQGRYSYYQLLKHQILNLALFPGGAIPFVALAQYMGW